VRDATGKTTYLIGTSRDVTDRVELEEKLRRSQKMEAMGQQTGGIAHDFNNLLTVVMGNLDLLSRAREVQWPKLINNAMQAVERARELTEKLLAFGRRQPLKPEPTDLRGLIAGMDDMLMQSLRGDVRLELELPDNLWPVEVDQAQLQVALINLAANARDAMPRGGILRIKAENTLWRNTEAFEGVAVSVTDTGHGMPREVLERAFDPFFTTKEEGKGTGLGLAQVYGFVNQSGGSAEIRSEVGKGTTVVLYLPRCVAPVSVRATSAAEPLSGERELRILLVEDNVQVAEVAGSILREHGHEVVAAHSADQALRLLESKADFDMVFSDLVMPGELNGLDLARAVRARWPFIPVLLATGYSEAGGRATQEGFPLLAKPYRAANLVAMVERVAAGTTTELLRKDGS
jgi:nitrogen-specific signal transduction histidine kinase/ActR/RegA family two-component response regulator